MCEFKKSDVIMVAEALIEDAVMYSDGDHVPYYYCEYCGAELKGYYKKIKDFKHDLDCPVLVAQDILTAV